MRKCLKQILLFLCWMICVCAFAQKSNKQDEQAAAFFKNIKPFVLNQPKSKEIVAITIPFSKVDFIDGRFDTSFLGYGVNVNHFVKLTLNESLAAFMGSTTNKNTSLQGKKALCIIHEFKITVDDTVVRVSKLASELSMKKTTKDSSDSYIQMNTIYKLHAKIDVFIEDQQLYKAAFRFDTLILDAKKATPNNSTFIDQFLLAFNKKLYAVNIEKVASKKGYALNDIKESIQEKFNIPILKDQAYKKGIYTNFKELVNNSPSYDSFEIKRDEYTDEIYVQEPGGSSSLLRSAFGYSDGKHIWVLIKNKLFQLHPQNGGFSFFGFTGLSVSSKVSAGEVLLGTAGAFSGILPSGLMMDAVSTATARQKLSPTNVKPYLLNLENGSIY